MTVAGRRRGIIAAGTGTTPGTGTTRGIMAATDGIHLGILPGIMATIVPGIMAITGGTVRAGMAVQSYTFIAPAVLSITVVLLAAIILAVIGTIHRGLTPASTPTAATTRLPLAVRALPARRSAAAVAVAAVLSVAAVLLAVAVQLQADVTLADVNKNDAMYIE